MHDDDIDFMEEAERVISKALVPTHPHISNFLPMHVKVFFKPDLRMGRNGMAQITMQIPYEYRDLAYKLIDCVNHPMDLYIRPEQRRLRVVGEPEEGYEDE